MEQRINDIINYNNQSPVIKEIAPALSVQPLGRSSLQQLVKIKENTKIILSVLQISVTITNTEIYY